jgi:hypothetical protein
MPDIAGVVRPTTLLAILWFAAKFLLDARNVSGTVIWHHDLFKRKHVTELQLSLIFEDIDAKEVVIIITFH